MNKWKADLNPHEKMKADPDPQEKMEGGSGSA
jgi:hypothetical protein